VAEVEIAEPARPGGAARPDARRLRPRRRRRRRDHPAPGDPRNIAWLYVLPGLAFYGLFTLAPLVHTVYYSLFSWDGLTAKTYVGLANYSAAIADHTLRSSFVHAGILIVFYSAIPVLLGLLLTAALTRHPIRGFRFFRTALFLPQLIAGVVIAQAWTWIYDDSGPVNWALRKVGLSSLARPWLGDFTWALPAIGTIGTWITYGLCMVLFVSGVQKIPSSLYDAARVDGAGAFREFFAVTLPGLRGEILVAVVLTTINALRSFDIVYNTTAGGPGGQTVVPSLYMYQNAFLYNKVGYAAAVATILAAAIFILAAIVLRVGDRSERA
jgi:raffinose/stachyose/melibiose transport system permease protein